MGILWRCEVWKQKLKKPFDFLVKFLVSRTVLSAYIQNRYTSLYTSGRSSLRLPKSSELGTSWKRHFFYWLIKKKVLSYLLYYNLLNWEIKKVELFLICFTDIDISLQWDISPKSIIIFNLTTTIWILSIMVTCAWCHVYCRRYCTGEYESCNNFLNCVFHFRVFLRTRTSGISAPCRSACSCVLVFCYYYYYYLFYYQTNDRRGAACSGLGERKS